MTRTLGDVRKVVETFDDQVAKAEVALGDENSVRALKDDINREIVNGLPDETELSEKAERCLCYIEGVVRRNAKLFSEKAKKA